MSDEIDRDVIMIDLAITNDPQADLGRNDMERTRTTIRMPEWINKKIEEAKKNEQAEGDQHESNS